MTTSHASLISLVIDCLHHSEIALTSREIARRLLNARAVTDVTLEVLNERLQMILKVEHQTRAEASRLVRRGEYYELSDSGIFPVVDELSDASDSSLNSTMITSDELSDESGDTANDEEIILQLKVKVYPLFRQVSSLLRLSHGERYSVVDSLRRSLRRTLKAERESEMISNFEDVETWIRAHLIGGSARLAKKLWEGSGRLLSLEDFEFCWSLIEFYQLMRVCEDGVWRLNHQGMALLNQEEEGISSDLGTEKEVLRYIDQAEGLIDILMICLEHNQVTQDQLIAFWGQVLRQNGKRRNRAWIVEALKSRLKNLADRGFVYKKQDVWRLSEEGLSWLRKGGIQAPSADQEALEQVWSALKKQRDLAKNSIASLLDKMEPRHFEALICELLESMGYDEIHLTPNRNDMGVDVIATIELGISSVREVIQVKRQHRAIHRPVLDALRGSLHRFEAVRGTLITTSSFSKGTQEAAFERGAAPITLIDGSRLIELLMQHELGVKPVQIKLWQVEAKLFEVGSEREWPLWRFKEE
jgi:restriction system protein